MRCCGWSPARSCCCSACRARCWILWATLTGIYYPPSALFLVALLFVLAILMHFSIVITRLTQENRELARHIALLRHEQERSSSAGEGEQDSDQRDVADGVERDQPQAGA